MMAKMIQGWEIHNSDTMDAFGARVSHGPAQPFDGRQAKGRVTQMAQRFEVINAQGQRVPFELDIPGQAGVDKMKAGTHADYLASIQPGEGRDEWAARARQWHHAAKHSPIAPGVHAAVVELMAEKSIGYVGAFDLLKASRPEIFEEVK